MRWCTWLSLSIRRPPPPGGRFRPARWTGRGGCAPRRHPLSPAETAPSEPACLLQPTGQDMEIIDTWMEYDVRWAELVRRETDAGGELRCILKTYCVRGILFHRRRWSPSPWTSSCVCVRGDGGVCATSGPGERELRCRECGDLEGNTQPTLTFFRRSRLVWSFPPFYVVAKLAFSSTGLTSRRSVYPCEYDMLSLHLFILSDVCVIVS